MLHHLGVTSLTTLVHRRPRAIPCGLRSVPRVNGVHLYPAPAVCNVVQLRATQPIYDLPARTLPVRGVELLSMCMQTLAVGTRPETLSSFSCRLLFLQNHHHYHHQQQGVRHRACSVCIRRVLKIARGSINYVTSFCPSAWNNSAPTGQTYVEFDIWVFFFKSAEKI